MVQGEPGRGWQDPPPLAEADGDWFWPWTFTFLLREVQPSPIDTVAVWEPVAPDGTVQLALAPEPEAQPDQL